MDLNIKQEGGFEYIEEGEGEVLLLLHGLFGALSNWRDVLDEFSKDYKIVIPLMPIFDMPMIDVGVKGLAKFVHSFVEHKKYESFTLLGNSLGGHVALVYTKYYPQKVKAMMLTGSSGLYENSMGGTYPKRGDYEYIKQKVAYTFYDPEAATKELVDEVFEITNNRLKVIRILAMAKSAIRYNMAEDIATFKMPVCLIWGKDDRVTPPEVAEEFHSLLDHSELHWIDKCGHAAMMEQPEQFNSILSTFLKQLFSK
ncbi:MAG: pimeloyl-ACP methyl ester carboxylesterase [Bacteroidia bacterium]|jgi:pimeloyl-ACP methyl ester carboxylesterase